MRLAPEPASDKQVNYMRALGAQISRLMEEGHVLADEVERVADSSIDKRTASELIDVLVQVVTQLKQSSPPVSNLSESESLVTRLKADAAREAASADARRKEAQAIRDAYNLDQVRQLGGIWRDCPGSFTGYIRVWKARPNELTPRHRNSAEYGWRWECNHPNHTTKVVGGVKRLGWQATIESAQRHAMKYHPPIEDKCV